MQINDHTQRAHSRYSPSGSSRWLKCPRSFWWADDFPNEETVFAAEGTAVHELSEAALVSGNDCADYIGQRFNGFEITDEMAEVGQAYVDTVRGLGGTPLYEILLKHPDVEGMFGTADAIVLVGKTLNVVDLKAGRGVFVEATNNSQLRTYAAMAYHQFSLIYDIEEVTTTICQKRLNNFGSETLSVEDLLAWERDVLLPGVRRLDEEPDVMVAGAHCKFCPALGVCPEAARVNIAAAQAMFDSEDEPSDLLLHEPTLPAITSLTLDQRLRVSSWRGRIESFLKKVDESLLREAESGASIPGKKVVEGRTTRRWSSESDVASMARGSRIDVWEEKLLSPAALEKQLGKAEFNTLFGGYVTRAPGAHTLVDEDDKRPAIEFRTAEEMFDDETI